MNMDDCQKAFWDAARNQDQSIMDPPILGSVEWYCRTHKEFSRILKAKEAVHRWMTDRANEINSGL